MKVIVTGGAGFIGSHLVDCLVDDNHDVIVIDDLSSGQRKNVSQRAHLVVHDVRKPFPVKADLVYHLACPATPVAFIEEPRRVLTTAVLGTINAADAVLPGGHIVHASSSEVYGNSPPPQCEYHLGNVNPIGERSCYQEGKRASESAIASVSEESIARGREFSATIVRFFNIYGCRMPRDGRILRTFIDQALEGSPLTVYGDGSRTRSYCHVADVVNLLLKISKDATTGISLYNVGDPRNRISSLDLAKMVVDLTRSDSEIVTGDDPRGQEPMHRQPYISAVSQFYDWVPEVNFRDGVFQMIEWCRNHAQG